MAKASKIYTHDKVIMTIPLDQVSVYMEAPSMLALLEKALPMIEEEASRREYAPVEDGEGIGGYWTEMRELANEISAEIDRARGKEVKQDG